MMQPENAVDTGDTADRSGQPAGAGREAAAQNVRGLLRLSFDAARMVTGVVEDVHNTILTEVGTPFARILPGLPPPTPGRLKGIPGLVYRTIHAGYDVAEATLVAASDLLASTPAAPPALVDNDQLLAILNGVWGHHLATSANPLATQMSFRHDARPLIIGAGALRNSIAMPAPKVLLLVHGLCMDDSSWLQGEHNYGELGQDLGYTPLYLRYNTGLHVSTNGKRLADMLEALVDEWGEPLDELAIIGFSMGGLVARSAVHYGTVSSHRWVKLLRRLVFLGTPHHGSRLERVGNWVATLLGSTRFSAPFHRLGATRSAGITDLRHGSLLDEDWQDAPHSGPGRHEPRAVALPACIRCYAAAVTLGAKEGDAKDRLLGDGLVPLHSALGKHKDSCRSLTFGDAQQWVGYGMRHLDLLNSAEVYGRLHEWLTDGSEA